MPRGGFDIEVLDGTLHAVNGDTHAYYDRGVTYTVAGAMVRSWQVDWTAPDLSRRPAPIDIWIAGMAADGGHVVALNVSDQAEKYDAVATFHGVVVPSEGAVQAWLDLPLRPPIWNATDSGYQGSHADRNATHLAWRTDDQWHSRPTGSTWRIVAPSEGDLWIRSEGADRASPEVHVQRAGAPIASNAPVEATPITPMIVIFALLCARRIS